MHRGHCLGFGGAGSASPCSSWPEPGRPAQSPTDPAGRSPSRTTSGGVGPIWRLQRIRPDALAVVPDPTGLDREVVAITLRSGDMADQRRHDGARRAIEADHLHLPTGTDVWYGFSLYVPWTSRLWTAGSSWAVETGLRRLHGRPQPGHRQPLPERGVLDHHPGRRSARRALRGEGRHPRALESSRLPREPHAQSGRLPAGVVQRAAGRGLPGPLGYPDDRDRVYFKIGLYRDTLAVR